MRPEGAWWRLLTLPILATLATGIGVYAGDAPVVRAVVAAVTVGAVTWLVLRGLTAERTGWPVEPPRTYEPGRIPRAWEIAGFDNALERPRYLVRRVIGDVRRVAVPVLAKRQVDLLDPAHAGRARKLLGERNFQLLTAEDPGEPPARELAALVDRVTWLATVDESGPRRVRIDPRLTRRPRRWSIRSLVSAPRSTSTGADPPGPPDEPVAARTTVPSDQHRPASEKDRS